MKIGKLIGYNATTGNMDNGSMLPDVPFKLFTSTITDANYEDYSSIEHWDQSNFLDWARRRDEISPLFYAEAGAQLQNFTGMSNAKKLIACKYFLVPYNVRTQIVSDQEDADNWDYLLCQTKKSRERCVEAMRVKVGQYMRIGTITLAQTQHFYQQVNELIEWFNATNSPNFKQWITNEVGSPYENAGFAQMPYYTTQMRDDLMSIYNGNY
jgi:hypothetical protein